MTRQYFHVVKERAGSIASLSGLGARLRSHAVTFDPDKKTAAHRGAAALSFGEEVQ